MLLSFLGKKMEKDKNRIRDKQINFRVTGYEYSRIQEQFHSSGKQSLREFMVESAINSYIVNVDYTEIKDLAYEINKIGTNINQIAHKVNSDDRVMMSQINELQEDMDLIWRMIRKTFYQIT